MKPDFDTLVCPSPGGCAGGAVAGMPSQLASAMELRLMDRMPLMVFLLGPEREIAYGNELFLNSLRPEVRNGILGLRLGEALGCVHVLRYKKRCGTTPACRNCGAAKAILKSLRGIEHCEECHLTVRKEDGVHALDLQILARPCEIAQQGFSLCSALDISHERTLASQHRAFLHSMINAAGGMDMLLTLTGDGSDEDMEDRLSLLHNSARTMLAAVLYQYDVMAAESGRLEAFRRTAGSWMSWSMQQNWAGCCLRPGTGELTCRVKTARCERMSACSVMCSAVFSPMPWKRLQWAGSFGLPGSGRDRIGS